MDHRHAAVMALRLSTFRSRSVVNVAILPSRRESVTGVQRLKDEIPLGHLKIIYHRFGPGFREGTIPQPKMAAVAAPGSS